MPRRSNKEIVNCPGNANGCANGTKKALFLAAVCASLSANTDAFAVPSGRQLFSVKQCSSTAVLSSPNDDQGQFFKAPTPRDEAIDTTATVKASAKGSMKVISAERRELERMEVADDPRDDDYYDYDDDDDDDEFLDSITTQASPSPVTVPQNQSPHTSPQPQPQAVPMNVDGNGTGALMNRSHAAGGANAPLMVTSNKPRHYPIDSGRDRMQAPKSKTEIRPGVRLVRYQNPSVSAAPKSPPTNSLKAVEEPTKRLILASSLAKNNESKSTIRNSSNSSNKNNSNQNEKPVKKTRRLRAKPKSRSLIRYNTENVDETTDHDGMETPEVQQKRDRVLKANKSNLVRYSGTSQQKRLETPTTEPETQQAATEEDHQKGRKTLADDVGYANRYTGLTDFNLAKKTGLAVNKPISLWVERDKFL
mmetsp:Transcript_7602/g.18961  ORF Transcript_7602/g.18961 Transcript_7602/m.18961 type:complete len:421 (-) Transcript_7602:735-1997(-)|eukprot:CAMPEP_0172387966 /NCGR_PEP_ID=MMETSP1061-20121228/5141_1 /TAXON_ID=37318 /ORGANISM="Pseudo-nitzschia pungens, Strain cf. pungens" /LENGTH=420 /DNA_ID=CAMNT_0013117727 /DNA_START=155 /DNA_END=1417 /DNA_ORIENTATION=+